MSRKKTSMFTAIVSSAIIVALTACSGTAAPSAETGVATEANVSAAATMDTVRVWSDNAHEKELRLAQIEVFNQTTGKEQGISIEYTVYGTNWEDTIKIAAQSNDAPDLMRPNGTFLKDFVEAGYLVPISDLPDSEAFLARYEGTLTVNQHIFNGKPYTLPYNLTTYKFVINRDLFDKNGITQAPETWDDVVKYAKTITDNGNGIEYGYALGLQSGWISTAYVTRPCGGDVGNIGFDNETLKFNYTALAPKLEALQQMVADGSVLPGASGMDADAMRAQFAEGRVGMLAAVSFDVGVYNEQFPAKCNWEVVDIPKFVPGERVYKEICDATSLLGVGKAAVASPEHAAKVEKVLEFFYSDENSAQMYEQSLYIPFRAEAIALATKDPEAKGFAEFADVPDKALMLPMPDTFVTVEGQSIQDTIIGLLQENPDKDALTALSDLDARYNAALAEQVSADVLDSFKMADDYKVKRDE
jgi:multiple sugar transport system substrate-binding protein